MGHCGDKLLMTGTHNTIFVYISDMNIVGEKKIFHFSLSVYGLLKIQLEDLFDG